MPTEGKAKNNGLIQLYDQEGQRRYLIESERHDFAACAEKASPEVRTFCLTFLYTGCHISEALSLQGQNINFDKGTLTLKSSGKQQKLLNRSIPIPSYLLDLFYMVHNCYNQNIATELLWSWTRPTAWRKVKAVFAAANIVGSQATIVGLRHSFGVICAQKRIPLPIIQKWMGHRDLKITATYFDAVDEDERTAAARLWKNF